MKKANAVVETSVVTYKEKALAELKITPAEIAKKVTEYMALKVLPDDPKSYKVAREALTTCVHTRTGVDKRRKELNEDDQARIKARNEAAKELVAPLAPAEKHLEDELGLEDGRRAEVKAEKARKEKERVDGIRAKIESFRAIILTLPGKTAKELSDIIDNLEDCTVDDSFMEFKAEAQGVLDEVKVAMDKAFTDRVAWEIDESTRKEEAARLAKQKAEQEAEAKKLADEKAKLEAEKKAEQERKDREEFERKAKERAEAEARAKVEREASEKKAREEAEAKAKADREAKEAAEKARQEALRPDREKIMAFAEAVIAVRPPEMKDKKAIKCVNAAVEKIDRAISEMREEAKRL